MTACCLALQCTFKWLHLKNDLSLRRSAKYCVFLQDKNGSQFRWNRKVEVRKCLPGTFRVVPSFKFVLSKMTASKIISEESLCLTKKNKNKKITSKCKRWPVYFYISINFACTFVLFFRQLIFY